MRSSSQTSYCVQHHEEYGYTSCNNFPPPLYISTYHCRDVDPLVRPIPITVPRDSRDDGQMYAFQQPQFPDWRLSACGDLIQIAVQLLIEENVSLVDVAVVWLVLLIETSLLHNIKD